MSSHWGNETKLSYPASARPLVINQLVADFLRVTDVTLREIDVSCANLFDIHR